MGRKAIIYKFDPTNKRQIRGRVGHTRTGACHQQGEMQSRNETAHQVTRASE